MKRSYLLLSMCFSVISVSTVYLMIVFNILRHYTLVNYVTVDSVKLMPESSVKCLCGLPSIVEVKVLVVLS